MIGIYTKDEILKKSIKSKVEASDVSEFFLEIEGLFIDWCSTESRKTPSKEFAHQAALVTYYSKKNIPISIFDRHRFINTSEYKWLKKFRVYLFEPAINYRTGFSYLPHWIDTSVDSIFDNTERHIDLAYIGNRNIPSFEKYYLSYTKKYNNRAVSESSDIDWRNVKFTIALDSENNYNEGYLSESITKALSYGCMVLCPIEHKYFTNMFHMNVVENINDMEYLINGLNTEDMRMASVLSIYENIKKRYPEFLLNNITNKILENLC